MARSKMNPTITVVTFASSLLVFGCSGGPVCKELGSCGGSPVGAWAQREGSEHDGKYCQERQHIPPPEFQLQDQPSPTARMRLPESTHLDWCYSLILSQENMNAIKRNIYYWENLPYRGGTVSYNDAGEYTLNFARTGRVSQHYSRTCISQYGHELNCGKLQERLTEANEGNPAYADFQCAEDASKGGCDCSFQVLEIDVQVGTFSATGSTLTHFSKTPTIHYGQASVCVQGDTMQLSGLNNSFVWNRPGLRTLELVRINCQDGVKGPGESGVDCGLWCPQACRDP